MRAIDEEAQVLINDVLRKAGVLASDGDAEALKGYVIGYARRGETES